MVVVMLDGKDSLTRITAIRSNEYKLVYDHDKESKSFFRVGRDIKKGIDELVLSSDYEESMKPFVEYLEKTSRKCKVTM